MSCNRRLMQPALLAAAATLALFLCRPSHGGRIDAQVNILPLSVSVEAGGGDVRFRTQLSGIGQVTLMLSGGGQ